MRQDVFGAVQRLDGAGQDALRTGQVVSRAITDLQLVQGLLAMVPLTVGQVVLFVVSLATMLWLSPLLTVVALVVAAGRRPGHGRRGATLFPATWAAQQRAADVAEHVEETVTGVRVVKGFGQEDAGAGRGCEGRARALFAERMRAARMTARLSPALQALPTLGQVGVLGLGGVTGAARGRSPWARSWPSPPTSRSSSGRPGMIDAAGGQRRSSPGPAWSACYDLIDARPRDRRPAGPGRRCRPGRWRSQLDDVRFGYAGRRRRCSTGFDLHGRGRRDGRARRPVRLGQVHVVAAAPPLLRPAGRRVRLGGVDRCRRCALADLRGALGRGVRGGVPVLRHHRRQHRLRPAGRHRGAGTRGRRGGAGRRVHRRAARRLRHARRRARADALGRPAPAAWPWPAR